MCAILGEIVEIKLNGQKIEYEIEAETSIGQVIDSMSKWLYQRGGVIVSVRMNGKSIDFADDEKVRALSIKKVDLLEMESQNARLLVIETINELGQYLDRVARLSPQMTDDELNEESVGQLLEGLTWCIDVLNRVEELLHIKYNEVKIEGEKFHKRLLRLGDIRDHIDEASRSGNRTALHHIIRESVAPLCDSIVRALPQILDKANLSQNKDDVLDELDDVLDIVRALPENFENIAVKISIGDSAKGMEEFAAAVGSLEKAFSLIDHCRRHLAMSLDLFTVEDKSFDERSAAISKVLDELIAAFERKDRVLIGDLIEYEIAPETEALCSILEQIQRYVKGQSH